MISKRRKVIGSIVAIILGAEIMASLGYLAHRYVADYQAKKTKEEMNHKQTISDIMVKEFESRYGECTAQSDPGISAYQERKWSFVTGKIPDTVMYASSKVLKPFAEEGKELREDLEKRLAH